MDRIQETLNEIARVDSAISARLAVALDSLLQARDYSQAAGASPWDFAVEIAALRAFGLTNNDLRWLSLQGVIAHAEEVPNDESDRARTFQPPSIWYISDRTCAILTDLGLDVARSLQATEADPQPAARVEKADEALRHAPESQPLWNSSLRELIFCGRLVKRFRVPSPNQERILSTFQEERWPDHIDDPLPPVVSQDSKRRLLETIKSLNRNQKHHCLQFMGDGTGTGVIWQPRGPSACWGT